MARTDWDYIAIPKEQSTELEEIVKNQGRLYGIIDKNELVRAIIADYITRFREKKDLMMARKTVCLI